MLYSLPFYCTISTSGRVFAHAEQSHFLQSQCEQVSGQCASHLQFLQFSIYFLPLGILAPGLPTYNPKKAAPAPTMVDIYIACEFVGSGNCINQVTDL